MKTTPIPIRMPNDLLAAAKKHAAKKKTTLPELVRKLLAEEVGHEVSPLKNGRPSKSPDPA